MRQRQRGNGSNSDGQSTENCIVSGMRVFGDFHIFIKYIASPLQHEIITTIIHYTTPNGVRPGSFSKGVCKVFSICQLLRQMMQHV